MPIEEMLIDYWILEDAPHGDLTACIIPSKFVRAHIIAKQNGLLAGMFIIRKICDRFGVRINVLRDDGEEISAGDVVAELLGNSHTILLIERTMLNILMYLSGVATTTKRFVEKARKVNPKIRIAATRKTMPGLRWATKEAVRIGGGDTHRYSLSDCYLIKDNHIRVVGSTRKAIKLAREKASFTKLIEVEVRTVEEAIEAALAGANIIMFDNMSPTDIERAIEELKRRGLRNRVLLEASGGITMENVENYARLDIDIISTSVITLNPKPVDMSLKIVQIVEE